MRDRAQVAREAAARARASSRVAVKPKGGADATITRGARGLRITVQAPAESLGSTAVNRKVDRSSRHGNKRSSGLKEASVQLKVAINIDVSLTASDLQCPVCLDTIRTCTVVGGCLHRFCNDCISRSLRSSKLECPSCRIHIPSRRSLRTDERFDAVVHLLYPPSATIEPPSTTYAANSASKGGSAIGSTARGALSLNADIKNDLQEYRRLHKERTAAIRAAASTYVPGKSQEALTSIKKEVSAAYVDSDGPYHKALAGAAGTTAGGPFSPLSAATADVDGAQPMRVDDVSGEVGLILRNVPDVHRYNEIISDIKDESLLDFLRTSVDYSLHRPHLVVPARAKLPDLRIFIKKMLSQVNKHVETSQIVFGLLDQSNKVTLIRYYT